MSTTELNRVQDLQFQLIRLASFNCFDGDFVADSLLACRDLWRAVMIDRAGYSRGELSADPIDFIKLRDLPDGYWNVDTLYILPAEGKDDELERLARTWSADEIDWQNAPHVGPVLRVWFD